MDDERWEAGMPVLDRQATVDPIPRSGSPDAHPIDGPDTRLAAAGPDTRPAAAGSDPRPARGSGTRSAPVLPPSLQGLPPRSVPEVAPTPLQKHYVLLSVPVLILGAIAITALEIGTPLDSPLIKLCVAVAAPLLVITTADAIVRIWRSAWAWMPVDRTKGLFRIAWVLTSLVGLAGLVLAAVIALAA